MQKVRKTYCLMNVIYFFEKCLQDIAHVCAKKWAKV